MSPPTNNLAMNQWTPPHWNTGLVFQSFETPLKAIDQWQFVEKDSKLIVCYCALARPPNPPLPCQGSTIQTSEKLCSALEAFPSIPSAFQKEIHQNGISSNYYRIQLDSGKGPKSFHVGKTKAGVTMKKVTAALLSSFSLKFFHLFLSSSFLSGSSHYCVWHWRWTDSWSVEVSQGGKCRFIFFWQLLYFFIWVSFPCWCIT